jgi:hypothetical protein
MNISPVEIPLPAEYLPTGDHALIVAWAALDDPERPGHAAVAAVLCLEDGRAEIATTSEFKFDYRYDLNRQRFVDVSGVPIEDDEPDEPEGDEDEDGDSDQEPPGDGGQGVPGRVPEADGAGEGDPG